ncbi:Guanosine-5'-triphosphate,3'-diphosphate pyrophosphatase [Roseovarius albus]|uniref:Guanosine-5'-triphosphate,3'-diphosphate pyrophosphatase n=1 Tax=Roseovarius albus TaxID=1247867 RepID=A0A1X6ZHQ8_9RHOB|nr:Ppx/GppA family phosphatase [Roseovarius albus]SLN51608.1 Guanosine-5'-triphosphate,3'-diphosphate pyrophosphatase [Roseovarius albus]
MNKTVASAQNDWGPFRRPLFNDPSARALSRVGVVDVGSNSVRMVVFDGAARSPAYFFNEKIMCALGSGMAQTGRLNPEGRVRALAALKRFRMLGEAMGTGPLSAVATAAVREAEDGPSFRDEVERETGIKLWVVDGQEEARLSAQGVLLGWPGAYGLVCDIGGSSMELAEINGGEVGNRISSDLGPLKLRELQGGKKARKELIRDTLSDMHKALGPQEDRLFLVGGSWRAIAKIDMARRGYPLLVLHEYRMTPKAVRDTADYISLTNLESLKAQADVSSARISLVPHAAEVLREIVKMFKPHDIAVSSYGIREGLLYEQMPQRLRDRDPLIESCHFAESKDARRPGQGKVTYNFIEPLFRKASADRIRLIKAACLLHDVSWRSHPDYRAEDCFENATRSNLGGLKHSERIFLGLALHYRYSNSSSGTRFEKLLPLVSPKEAYEAKILGKAMRLAAMLWFDTERPSAELQWFPKKRLIELKLSEDISPLFGEVAQARFASLAETLEASTKVTF